MSWSFTDNCSGCELAPNCTDTKFLPKVIATTIQGIHALAFWDKDKNTYNMNGHLGGGSITMLCGNKKVTPKEEPASPGPVGTGG